MKIRIALALILFGSVLVLPFLLRKKDRSLKELLINPDTVVIISAHSEPMKHEFEQGFRAYYRKRFHKEITIDWRSPGGTSDIVRYIADRYKASFRREWESDPANPPWDSNIASAFDNPNILKDPAADAVAKKARKAFLASNAGIGIDLFAGGGTYDQSRHARQGYAVDGELQKRHKEYFKEEILPAAFGGDHIYDRQGRYYGVCLSSFGICCNMDRLNELAGTRDKLVPRRWRDLGEGVYFNTVTVADPTKSGSANKCFEIILQQEMSLAVKDPGNPRVSSGELDQGWANGFNLIKRIIANTRTITDSAGKVVRDIASGESAVGMAIDFYGLTEQEWNSFQMDGKPVIRYIAPLGGTAVSADPIQMLRGAPHPEAARAFLDYIIGPEGQKLMNFKVGTPGGPEKYALRRSPVRKDLYAEKYKQYRSDPDYDPYEAGKSFVYRGRWTGRYFSMIRLLIRTLALDVQDELRLAWKAILDAGGPEKVPLAYKEFCKLPFAYRDAAKNASLLRVSRTRTKLDVASLCRKWSDDARKQYLKTAELAKAGK